MRKPLQRQRQSGAKYRAIATTRRKRAWVPRLSFNGKARLIDLFAKIEAANGLDLNAKFRSYRHNRSLTLGTDGVKTVGDAVALIKSVAPWKEAYPAEVMEKRIVDAYFAASDARGAVDWLVANLIADCKDIRAYVPFFGFHLDPEVRIPIGPYELTMLGEERLEDEIIGRVREHVRSVPDYSEEFEIEEVDRWRKLLVKHKNIPMLIVDYYGSVDGARAFIEPIAQQVAPFLQFCVGALTDQYYDKHVIIDFRGKFTGEFAVLMPVMTRDFDRLAFPDLRGNPWGCQFRKADVEKLIGLGIIDLAELFTSPPSSNESIDALLMRGICCFADGERAVNDLSRITSYVTAAEVFFSQNGRATESVCAGLAACQATDVATFEEHYDLAKWIYKQRSAAVHMGFEPTAAFLARKAVRVAILRMIEMRDQLTNRKAIRKWLNNFMSEDAPDCSRCGRALGTDE